MYLLAIKEIILFLTGGGKKEDKREYKQVENEKKSEVEIERQQEEIPKQETPHSFSTSPSPSFFSLQDILLKKKSK
jgi:hypothetical protein